MEDKDRKAMFGLFRNSPAKHVWSEYRRVMSGEKRYMEIDYYSIYK